MNFFTLSSVRPDCGGLQWAANYAEAMFDKCAISQLMQYVHHLVMTTYKGLKDPSRLNYV